MGYTHYWSFNPPKRGEAAKVEARYQKAIKACNKVIQAYQAKADGYERLSGYSAFTSKYGGLKVNGKEDMAHEDFTMREHFKQNKSDFCKTARKPYDLVVVACLCILKAYLKDNFIVSSDGRNEDWSDGLVFAANILNRNLRLPFEDNE